MLVLLLLLISRLINRSELRISHSKVFSSGLMVSNSKVFSDLDYNVKRQQKKPELFLARSHGLSPIETGIFL